MIKCIAIDDEPLALRQLSEYIKTVPYLSLESSFESALEACAFMQEHAIDLVFADISMPDINGIELANSLPAGTKIIFITAHSEYAYDGFRIDAADYLLKPISLADFLQSVSKVNERYFKRNDTLPEIKQDKNHLFIKSEYRIIRICFSNIRYIESKREYVRIVLDGQEPISSLMSITKLEESLPASMFMRVHRSFIVNLEKITVVERNRIIFGNDTYIPIGDNYSARFQEYVKRNFI